MQASPHLPHGVHDAEVTILNVVLSNAATYDATDTTNTDVRV